MIMMVEAILGAMLAAISGATAVHMRLSSRLTELELKIAENYVTRPDLSLIITRMEDHMVRIENKLDAIREQNMDNHNRRRNDA